MALPSEQLLLERFMKLSIATAVLTIVLKVLAAMLTGSVGFLSDALESGVNLVAAVVGFIALRIAAKPADANHQFGHGKAEYVSALVEGAMIFVAAALIIYTSALRLLNPQPLEQPGIGLALSTLASVLNLAVGLALLKAGKKYRSATLQADGHHLLTDVWTSVGVLVGIALVALTDWLWLDPMVAFAVGINILWTGYKLLKESLSSLLSESLPKEEHAELDARLAELEDEFDVLFTSRRTIASGRQRLVYLTMDVPGEWTVLAAHDIADRIEDNIDELFSGAEVFIHVEPAGTVHRRILRMP
ncbi:cation diffusion facilitator family transporter [Corynebacterium simulans]|uniref:Cation diffusion facilitator transporter family protein n=1 Tax=Corynebacterium simulans TaxID=146827 RepID=A0ABR5VAD8_9CORY|nr:MULTISPECIES: cation diffusion facilitator family transporter [Corynebacterium]KXU18368.1 cation diffusion facilitator transporter family protein [Corynebacterium simulans]MCG7247770.1 cation diffusion facilitator family transporter [Corynebacterium simulans]MDK7138712.1 cation diffusion facilitator family transporter [Corynebacterium simulans]OFR39281.1 transporter [Corynebacterium sp. HMSC077D03]OFT32742.1 transporter [Corynebacterium sp. HMSC08C04]